MTVWRVVRWNSILRSRANASALTRRSPARPAHQRTSDSFAPGCYHPSSTIRTPPILIALAERHATLL